MASEIVQISPDGCGQGECSLRDDSRVEVVRGKKGNKYFLVFTLQALPKGGVKREIITV
jgi:hypothetical protein